MTSTSTSRLLISAACVVVVVAGIRSASAIIGPVMLALALTIVFHPLRARLERRLPRWAASVVVLVAAYVLILALTLALVVAVGRLAALIPTYAPDLDEMAAEFSARLADLGVADPQAAVTGSLDIGRVLTAANTILSGMASVFSDLFFIVTLLLFLAFDSAQASSLTAAAREHRASLVDALVRFAEGTRSYLGVSAVFGLIVAVVDTALLWALGVPGAFVWGVLAFVTNFIPNIGFVIGVIPPAVIGLLEGGPGLMLTVIVLYSVINVVIQSIIQPRYVGNAVGLSTTLTFLSLVFWTWVLGPLGALLAVPMSLLVRALLVDADPDGQWRLPSSADDRTTHRQQPRHHDRGTDGVGRPVASLVGLLIAYFAFPVDWGESAAYLASSLVLTGVGLSVLARIMVLELQHVRAGEAGRSAQVLTTLLVLLVMSFSLAAYLLQELSPGQFVGISTRTDALYFTLSTMTTVGYGDVHAEGQLARGLVCGLIVFNVVVVASLLRAHTRLQQSRS